MQNTLAPIELLRILGQWRIHICTIFNLVDASFLAHRVRVQRGTYTCITCFWSDVYAQCP